MILILFCSANLLYKKRQSTSTLSLAAKLVEVDEAEMRNGKYFRHLDFTNICSSRFWLAWQRSYTAHFGVAHREHHLVLVRASNNRSFWRAPAHKSQIKITRWLRQFISRIALAASQNSLARSLARICGNTTLCRLGECEICSSEPLN
jgi:hypothetical protein